MKQKVVVTGYSCLCNLGSDKEEIVNNLRLKIDEKDRCDNENFKVTDFNLEKYFNKRELRRLSKLSKMSLYAIAAALEDSDVDYKTESEHIGLIYATGLGEILTTKMYLDTYIEKGAAFASPLHFHNSVHNAPPGLAAIKLGLEGLNVTISQKDLSFETAIEFAINNLKNKRIKYALVCASDENTDITYQAYEKLGFLTKDRLNNFEREDGFIASEGAAAFILELEDTARSRNQSIHGIIDYCKLGNVPCIPWKYPDNIKKAKFNSDAIKDVEYISSGYNGYKPRNFCENELTNLLAEEISSDFVVGYEKKHIGEFYTSGAVRFYLNLLMLENSLLIEDLSDDNKHNIENINKVLLQNITCGGGYSIIVLNKAL